MQAEHDALDRDGVVSLDALHDPADRIRAWRELAGRADSRRGGGRPLLTGRVAKEISFDSVPAAAWRAILTPRVVSLLQAYLTRPALVQVTTIRVPSSAPRQAPHSDTTLGRRRQVNVAFCVSPTARMRTEFVAGSHCTDSFDAKALRPLPSASAVAFDGFIWHAGGAVDGASDPRVFLIFVDAAQPPDDITDILHTNGISRFARVREVGAHGFAVPYQLPSARR